MTVENISWSISTKECCRFRRGLNPRPPGLQSDGASNWATEAGRRDIDVTLNQHWFQHGLPSGMVLSEWKRMHVASISFWSFEIWQNRYSDEAMDYLVKHCKARIVRVCSSDRQPKLLVLLDTLLHGELSFVILTHLAALRRICSIHVFFCIRAPDQRSILNLRSYQRIVC